MSVDQAMAAARSGLRRMSPAQAALAQASGALLIDTRAEAQRGEQGELPAAIVIDRTVLEWRLDPCSPAHIPETTSVDLEIVVVCREGYSSSLAAASLQSIGLQRATDMIGGVEGWIAAGLPVHRGQVDIRR